MLGRDYGDIAVVGKAQQELVEYNKSHNDSVEICGFQRSSSRFDRARWLTSEFSTVESSTLFTSKSKLSWAELQGTQQRSTKIDGALRLSAEISKAFWLSEEPVDVHWSSLEHDNSQSSSAEVGRARRSMVDYGIL